MKAAVFQKAHEPLTIEDVDLSELRQDELRVRTVCSGVCHSDRHVVDGMSRLEMPMVLGHESSGVVEQVGKDVSYVKPGDRVIMFKPFCGRCYYCGVSMRLLTPGELPGGRHALGCLSPGPTAAQACMLGRRARERQPTHVCTAP